MARTKQLFKGFGKISIVAGVTALPTPPVFVGDVGSTWNQGSSAPAEWDLEITANGVVGVVQDQITIASDDVDTVDFANNELDIAAHGLLNGDGPIQLTTTGTIPTGLALLTDYYVIYVGAGAIQLATSPENAIEGTAVTFSDVGAGTHSILGSVDGDPDGDSHDFLEGSNNSYRIKWLSYGLIGPAADGAVSLNATKGYSTRINHRPRTIAYALEATHPGTIEVTASAYPVNDSR